MTATRAMEFDGTVNDVGPIQFVSAQWRDDGSAIAWVEFKRSDGAGGGVRIDLDKRIFLDDLDIPGMDESVLDERAQQISALIAERKKSYLRSSLAHQSD